MTTRFFLHTSTLALYYGTKILLLQPVLFPLCCSVASRQAEFFRTVHTGRPGAFSLVFEKKPQQVLRDTLRKQARYTYHLRGRLSSLSVSHVAYNPTGEHHVHSLATATDRRAVLANNSKSLSSVRATARSVRRHFDRCFRPDHHKNNPHKAHTSRATSDHRNRITTPCAKAVPSNTHTHQQCVSQPPPPSHSRHSHRASSSRKNKVRPVRKLLRRQPGKITTTTSPPRTWRRQPLP